MPTPRAVILERITTERERQERNWSCQNDKHGRWALPEAMKLAVLAEEIGEVARALNDGVANNLRDELVQVAAVCVRWLGGLAEEQITLDEEEERTANNGHRSIVRVCLTDLAGLLTLLGVVARGEDGEREAYLRTLLHCCVLWLQRFDDDPIVDSEKRRVRESATNAWRPTT